MDRQYIDDRHVVARYLADQLSDSEREEFEAYCAQNPEMFREMEATARFKVGLAKLKESGELEGAVSRQLGIGAFVMRHAAALAAVAIGVAALLGGAYGLRAPVMSSSIAEVSGRFRAPLQVAETYEVLRMRDSEKVDQHVKLPATRSAIVLRVLPDEEGHSAYQAVLSRIDGNESVEIARATELPVDDHHFVSIYIDSSKLVPGLYTLIVVPDGQRKPERESSFTLVMEDN